MNGVQKTTGLENVKYENKHTGTEKKCLSCGTTKSVNCFYKNKHRKDGLDSRCMFCCRAAHKKYRLANHKKMKEIADRCYAKNKKQKNAYQMKRYKEKTLPSQKYWKDWMTYLKENNLMKCSICGYNKCFHAIDFHHTNSSSKKMEMGIEFRHKITPERISELKKTIPVCRNCHAELHFNKMEDINNG